MERRRRLWVAPARALFLTQPRPPRELVDQLHSLTDPEEVVRRSQLCEIDFLPLGLVSGASSKPPFPMPWYFPFQAMAVIKEQMRILSDFQAIGAQTFERKGLLSQ